MESRNDLHARHDRLVHYCRLVVCAALILLAVPVFALDIPDDCKVKNCGTYCEWACLDVLGRVHGIKPLVGIMAKQHAEYPDGFRGYPELVRGRLRSLGVRHVFQQIGDRRRDLLEKYADSRGCIVALAQGNEFSRGCHAVIVTHYGKNRVDFYCPDNPDRPWHCSRSWFDRWHDGHVLVVLPEESE